MPRRLLRTALRLLGPALLIVVVARMDHRAEMLAVLANADAWPVALAILLNVVNVHAKVLRWGALLEARGIRYPRSRQYAAFLSSLFVGMLTPGRVGDVLRAQYLRRDLGVAYAEGLASVVVDRICDLYVLVVFAALGVVRYGSVVAGDLATLAWAAVAATMLGPLVLLVPGVAEALFVRAYRRFGGGGDSLAHFLDACRAQAGRSLARTVPLTVLAFVVNYGQAWLMARALGLELSFYDVMCLMAIASLLALLPISVSGVGVRELFLSLAFPALGYSAEAGVGFGLLFFAVNHLVLIAAGFVSFQVAPPPTEAGTSLDSPKGVQ
jgi:uncharacterized membrane protein YbhN (UPF0104 family)